MAPKESVFQSAIIRFIKQNGHYVQKYPAVLKSGVPDIYGCLFQKDGAGLFFAMEVKVFAPATELQKWHVRDIRKNGGLACIFRYHPNWQETLLGFMKNPLLINEYND